MDEIYDKRVLSEPLQQLIDFNQFANLQNH